MTDIDPFYYSRDHDRGPGKWCVCGPRGFKITVGDKSCALLLGKVLSGKWDEAAETATFIVKAVTDYPVDSWVSR